VHPQPLGDDGAGVVQLRRGEPADLGRRRLPLDTTISAIVQAATVIGPEEPHHHAPEEPHQEQHGQDDDDAHDG
jgi:hypothetical protein